MTEKFRHKYRVQSARLPHWNYAWPAAYFVTICTRNRECYFGRIINGSMQLSPVGKLADACWQEIPSHTRNVELDAFMVMPNHVHGILILHDYPDDKNVEPRHALALQKHLTEKPIGQNRFQNQGKNTLSSIVGGYKSAVTKHAHRLGYNFAWQPRFYDHVIRNQKSLLQKENYILNNPVNWLCDPLFTTEKPS